MPLPTGFSSRPLSCAVSIAPRTLLPMKEGTSIPPCSTSRTTVPFVGSGVGVSGEVETSLEPDVRDAKALDVGDPSVRAPERDGNGLERHAVTPSARG